MNQVTSEKMDWQAACRWQQYEAELRVNLVRLAAIALFYVVHLMHYYSATGDVAWLAFLGLDAGTVLTSRSHIAVTCVVVAWAMLGWLVHRMLSGHIFPRWLMYVSTAGDTILLTATLVLTSGPTSPLVTGYFLIVMMSGLRVDLGLVRWTTAGAIASYLIVLGCAKWPIGLSKLNALPTVPRYQQLMVIAALLVAGVVVGQAVRQTRQLVQRLTAGADGEAES